MTHGAVSLQDLIRRRQAAGFVGRAEKLSLFGANLEVPVEDLRRRFVFCIHGDGGVGKTFLTRQLQRIASEHGAVCAYVDGAGRRQPRPGRGTTVEALAMLILCRVAQRNSSEARRLVLQFIGLPSSRYISYIRRVLAADLAELADIPGVDQVLVEEIRALAV